MTNDQIADRYRRAWQMRRGGKKYKEIAADLGVCVDRARVIVVKADRRLVAACNVYDGMVHDPIVYGVTHIFTHDGLEYEGHPLGWFRK